MPGIEIVPSVEIVPSDALLAWYDRYRRDLPWRAAPGIAADPYAVWVSEIMLQQTTVAAVVQPFRCFLDRWPTIADLAAADVSDVLHAWQGLGYYARARHLHACALDVMARHGGRFPREEAALRRLPGIGAYTAAAIAAIAFDQGATPVDANVLRVIARLFAVEDALPAGRARIVALAGTLTPPRRAGDYAQALMDLGATVCTPKAPACPRCPWQALCAARRAGAAEAFPRKGVKAVRPQRFGVVFWLVRAADGAVLLRRRPARGLLGGMMEFPSSAWRAQPWSLGQAIAEAPLPASWRTVAGVVRHTFTHFVLDLGVARAEVAPSAGAAVSAGTWVRPEHFGEHALPTVMKKVARLVEAEGAGEAERTTGRRRRVR